MYHDDDNEIVVADWEFLITLLPQMVNAFYVRSVDHRFIYCCHDAKIWTNKLFNLLMTHLSIRNWCVRTHVWCVLSNGKSNVTYIEKSITIRSSRCPVKGEDQSVGNVFCLFPGSWRNMSLVKSSYAFGNNFSIFRSSVLFPLLRKGLYCLAFANRNNV